MEVEIEEVASLLFREGIAEGWTENEDFPNYITQLASCGVEKLGKESAHLHEERSAILDQTKDLAYTNYKTFIHTAECSKSIYNDFTSVESHLEGLASCLPNLRTSVESFLATSKNLAQSRHLTSLTLTKHTQLLEILELPQLMDTCVRNGYYEEALEIVAYVLMSRPPSLHCLSAPAHHSVPSAGHREGGTGGHAADAESAPRTAALAPGTAAMPQSDR
ncbi:Conserved oligomeric Golgi complex subunit 8 [Chionoecetes opilio]|uniref:Conserved oligomeric Golgi complex subunit 8 n=1 Tax=Chionoecetes opilio TaxID=41210 RepID=A0A8J4XMN3_CHIOP|nr:Conserved oligomeric Golgi complex subunit 8 [Chionoecetes opilio]